MGNARTIFIGQGGGGPQELLLRRASRHGLIAGATGSGAPMRGLLGGLFRAR